MRPTSGSLIAVNKLTPPTCYWLPRPYTDEDQLDVNDAIEKTGAEFVPWATLRRLAVGMKDARKAGVELLVSEGPDDTTPRLNGWAAAVGAKHVVTGEIASAPPADVLKLLDSLSIYGNNGWADFKTNVGPMTKHYGQELANAGYGPDQVVGYYIGLGLGRDEALRLHAFLVKNVK